MNIILGLIQIIVYLKYLLGNVNNFQNICERLDNIEIELQIHSGYIYRISIN